MAAMDFLNGLVRRANSGSGSNQNASNSLSSIVSTLVPTAAVALVYLTLFFLLRKKQPRVYAPRTFLDNVDDKRRTPAPESLTNFNWISGWRKISDEHVLTHESLDGYLYLRYFKIMTVICFIGCLITWPVLFPINITGGNGLKQLDMLSFANVKSANRYYAHTFVAWAFLGFVMFMIARETVYWVNLRQAYLLTPRVESRISSRTVLFTSVPNSLLTETALRHEFPLVRRVWIATNTKELDALVKDREKTAMKLEGAEVKLSKIANKNRLKAEKKAAKKNTTVEQPRLEEGADPSSRWVLAKKRPSHRLTFLIGKKVDTIEWSRTHLSELEPQIRSLQATHREVISAENPLDAATRTGEKKTGVKSKIPGMGGMTGHVDLLPAAFIEFETQRAAQAAFAKTPRQLPGKMQSRCISSPPEDIIWGNLSKKKPERLVRTVIMTSIITVMIIFWAIPVAFVGSISNINSLTQRLPWLGFINHIPKVILGVVTGLLPVVLLAILMALVPIFCRLLARQTGLVTVSRVELKTQAWYFAFQVVNVFLVTTFASGASAVVQEIISSPGSATSLLAENLPKASNFYISYFILYGISAAASMLFNLMPLLWFNVLSPILDGTPRKKFNRWITLGGLQWGSTVPVFALLGVIAIAYACIAPLILGFATVGLALLYIAFRYAFFYTMSTGIDTKGAFYGRALAQLFVGIYLAEFCLVGLFAISVGKSRASIGPLVLMIIFTALSVAFHVYMNLMLKPFKINLSDDLLAEQERSRNQSAAMEDGRASDATPVAAGEAAVSDDKIAPATSKPKPSPMAHLKTGGFFAPWLLHGSKSNYPLIVQELRKSILADPVAPYTAQDERDAYFNPSITSERPKLWIVHDSMGISTHEVAESGKVIDISDEGASFNEKGKITWQQDNVLHAPIYEEKVEY